MKILISGSHGLVGTGLINSLVSPDHDVYRLVRHYAESDSEIEWNPDRYSIALARLEGFDAVVHLAAVVGDPACAREPELAREVNLEATSLTHTGRVRRFLQGSGGVLLPRLVDLLERDGVGATR